MVNKNRILALAIAATLTGCAVSPREVSDAAKDREDTITSARKGLDTTSPLPLIQHVHTAFLGSQSTPVAYEATLPPIFRSENAHLRYPALGSVPLGTIAQKIQEATKIPVRIDPDVLLPTKSLLAGLSQNSAVATQGNQVAAAGQLPSPLASSGDIISDSDRTYTLDFVGPLAKYLNLVTEKLNISWKYDNGTIVFYRFETKSWLIPAIPGQVDFKSGLTKGADASTGTQATGGTASGAQNTTGSFSTSTSSTRTGQFNALTSVEALLNGLKSPQGFVHVDPYTRLAVVRDTKAAVDDMSKIMDRSLGVMTRRVAIRVHTITVQINDGSQAGLNTQLIFNRISQGLTKYTVGINSPQSLVTATGANIGLSVVKPNSPLNGTSIVATAINNYGTIVDDDDETKQTVNGNPITVGTFNSQSYLAETTPSSASFGGTTGGTPGLTPGTVTTGDFINILPTVLDNDQVLLSYWSDASSLLGITTQGTGSGATLQQIQLPNVNGFKDDQIIGAKNGQTIVMYGASQNHWDNTSNVGIGGGSGALDRTKYFQVIMITPIILSSM
jgi:type IVB pilus formation R64 PilN family outer membrane protein